MPRRSRMFSTLLLLCHALVLPALLTSQIQSPFASSQATVVSRQSPDKTQEKKPHLAGVGEEGEEVTIEAAQQEKQGHEAVHSC